MKTLKQFMSDLGGYMPKAEGEQDFVKKHIVDKKEDMNGNGDDVFQATNVKTSERPNERHGYTDEDDDKAYHGKAAPAEREAKVVNWKAIMRKYNSGMRESIELEEKKLTPAELKKREEIAQAIARGNPSMDKSKKMAIATATAKKVAEELGEETKKKLVKAGKGVPASGAYDSIPLGITVAEEATVADTSLLEMFAVLDDEERQTFVEMLENDPDILKELAQGAE